jgi:hypothetical protein
MNFFDQINRKKDDTPQIKKSVAEIRTARSDYKLTDLLGEKFDEFKEAKKNNDGGDKARTARLNNKIKKNRNFGNKFKLSTEFLDHTLQIKKESTPISPKIAETIEVTAESKFYQRHRRLKSAQAPWPLKLSR